MNRFSPSGNFVNRVMNSVRKYESEENRIPIENLLSGKTAIVMLSAAGILFGFLNALRIALILLDPTLCL
jgi:hypothetical protein